MSSSPTLAEWLAQQPKGALTRLMHTTKLAWSTVCCAKRGEKVGLKTALLISRATHGEVQLSQLTDDEIPDAEEDPHSRVA